MCRGRKEAPPPSPFGGGLLSSRERKGARRGRTGRGARRQGPGLRDFGVAEVEGCGRGGRGGTEPGWSGHVPEVRAWVTAVPWPSAALGRSSMVAPGPAPRAQRLGPGRSALSVPQSHLPVRASRLGSTTPRNRRLETTRNYFRVGSLVCIGDI